MAQYSFTTEFVKFPLNMNTSFLLTNNGLYKTLDLLTFSQVISAQNLDVCCLNHDIKTPGIWYGETTSWQGRMFDVNKNTVNLSQNVNVSQYIRSVQHDQMTNKVFFLTPFINNFGSTIAYGQITTYDPLTRTKSSLVLTIGGIATSIFYALDMKIDSIRRKIWILDAGNKRILRANIDTGIVDKFFSPSEMIAPCSMTIDLSTGDAYIRCLNGSITENEVSSTSSSASPEEYRETIYKANDEEIKSFIETQSFIKYDESWLSPNPQDINNIISTNLQIPLPKSDTMKFDQLRGNLWWTSKMEERIVFMANVKSKIMRSISLQPALDSIEAIAINNDSGEAIACGAKNSIGKVVLINNSCSDYMAYSHSGSQIVNNVMVIQSEFGSVVPFYFTVVENSLYEDQSSSSSLDNEIVNLDTINNSLIAEDEISLLNTSTPYITTRIWGQESFGVSTTNVWTVKGKTANESLISNAVSTPKFSWSSKLFSSKPIISATTPGGNLLKIEYDSSTNTTKALEICYNVIGGEINGLSVSNGDGNVYVSGNGKIAKVNLDPTIPGEEDIASSLSESSSSSLSGEDNPKQKFISQLISETGVGGLSVQFHSKSGSIYAISKQDGTLISFTGIDNWNNRQVYGPLPSPFKAVWSSQHSGVIVACKNSVHLVHVQSGTLETIYSTPTYSITDICIQNGNIGIAVSSSAIGNGFFKVLSKNLSSNLLSYKTENEFPSASCFVSTNKVLLALERTESGVVKTRFVTLSLNEVPSNTSSDFIGCVNSVFLDENFNIVFATFDSGDIITISHTGLETPTITKIGEITDGISFAAGSLIASSQELISNQKKIRVFVGSSEYTNDRWDSGVIETTSKEILYGGGDNLEPGEVYWVSISIMEENSNWSEPVSKQFVVPIM